MKELCSCGNDMLFRGESHHRNCPKFLTKLSLIEASLAIIAENLSRPPMIISNGANSNKPSVVYKPRLFIDGDQWCALYGENLQDGVCGFGPSAGLAMEAFDLAWWRFLEPIK